MTKSTTCITAGWGKEIVTQLNAQDARQDFAARVQNKRFCYYVHVERDAETGEYRPSVVIEGEGGHYPLAYTWGKDYAVAKQAEKLKNESMGLTDLDAFEIVGRSMRAETRRRL